MVTGEGVRQSVHASKPRETNGSLPFDETGND